METNSSENQRNQEDFDLIGRTLGDYELVRRLGRGGMANVYLAEQKSLRRKVALKVLRSDLSDDQSYVQRFHREAQAAASLVQANIVQIYEVGEIDGIHFIAQEYVRGQNLRQYLNRFGAVESIMAVNVLRQTAMALQKAAAADPAVIHRDIKPENIMISTSGEIKVTDFGLARVNDQKNLELTQIGITMGTPLYMSPEQVEGNAVDPRSDIYSLGITVYHMLSGDPPYQGDNALAIAIQHVKNAPTPLSELRPDVPAELVDIVHAMIAKKPDDRIQSASDLLKRLRKIEVNENEDWDALAEKIASTEQNASTVESRLAVTQQLQTVMSGKLKPWWQSPLVIATFAMACLASVGFAFATAKPYQDPLDIQITQSKDVPKQENVKDQFRAAQWKIPIEMDGQQQTNAMLDAAMYFQAVIDYFPLDPDAHNASTTRHYHYLAHQHLGEIYWRADHWEEAEKEFVYLKNLPDTYYYLRITGLAGHALYLDFIGQTDAVMELLPELEREINFELLNDYFQQKIAELMQRYPASASRF